MGKTEKKTKKQKENHVTKVTKIPKTKRQIWDVQNTNVENKSFSTLSADFQAKLLKHYSSKTLMMNGLYLLFNM